MWSEWIPNDKRCQIFPLGISIGTHVVFSIWMVIRIYIGGEIIEFHQVYSFLFIMYMCYHYFLRRLICCEYCGLYSQTPATEINRKTRCFPHLHNCDVTVVLAVYFNFHFRPFGYPYRWNRLMYSKQWVYKSPRHLLTFSSK